MATTDLYYDDSRLRQLFIELAPDARKKALKGAFRKAANTLKKQAVQNLRSSGLKSNRYVESGIRSGVSKKSLGFYITVKPKRGSKKKESTQEHKRKAKLAVVAFWAEGGTEDRYRTRTSRWGFKSKSSKLSTGKLKPFLFMEKTEPSADRLHQTLVEAIVNNIEKAAHKAKGVLS